MKKIFLLLILFKFSFLQAQFYCDFIESKSFYKQSSFVKDRKISKEVIVVQQLKNKILEDSFRIEVTNFNESGKPTSKFSGSKWNLPTIQDSFDYSGNKLQVTSFKNIESSPFPKVTADKEVYAPGGDTVANGLIRYEWDSSKNVKKVFLQTKKNGDKLFQLIFYDDKGRLSKIDFSPESERVRQNEYVYKKNRLSIYTVTTNNKECNEEMKFNAIGQLVERKIYFYAGRELMENKYFFTYYDNGLVATETKKRDGKLYTVATHYYY